MRADGFFLLINEIDEELVLEAVGESATAESAEFKKGFPFGGIIAAAACFAAIVVGIFMIAKLRMSGAISPGDSVVSAGELSANFVAAPSSETAESTSSTVSKAAVSTEPPEPAMFFKEPQPEDIVYDAEHNVSYVKNQLLISASLDAPEKKLERLFEKLGAEIVGYIEITNDYQIEFPTDKTLDELEAAADYLNSFSYIENVTLNLIMEINTDGID